MKNHRRPTGSALRPLPSWEGLGFAFHETDWLYRTTGRSGREPIWDEGAFEPFGDVSLSPAATFFSYGLGVFEGLKAHRTRSDRVLLFRPRDHARRFAVSAERLMMPAFPAERFVAVVEEVVRRNLRFVPPYGKGSFYLRPLEHAIEPRVGIAPGSQFWVLVFGTPVGRYFPSGEGLRLRVVDQGRVAPGGTGSAKAIGNYASVMAVAQRWKREGYDDVLYLDARGVGHVTETSGSNVFVKLRGGPLVTPPLDDQILPGVTRDSVLTLARRMPGLVVEERPITIAETFDAAEAVFCTGTAWTVAHVRQLDHGDRSRTFDVGALQPALLAAIRGIQLGDDADPLGWTHEVRAGRD
jgi:branched-chain amino acid aminotransferase